MSVYKVLEDGTRVYRNGIKYKPVALKDRKNKINRPDDPRARRYNNDWYLPLELAPDEDRIRPETRPDEDAYWHALDSLLCRCDVCLRPTAEFYRNRAAEDRYNGNTRRESPRPFRPKGPYRDVFHPQDG